MDWLRDKACRILGFDALPSHNTLEVRKLFLSPIEGSDGEPALSVGVLVKFMACLRFGDFNNVVDRVLSMILSYQKAASQENDGIDFFSRMETALYYSSLTLFFNILHCIYNVYESSRDKKNDENKTQFQSFLRNHGTELENQEQTESLKRLLLVQKDSKGFGDLNY